MTVEDPFYKTSKRDEIITNISSMPDEDKEKYTHIWLAELANGENIVQFDTRGNEINYGNVRGELEAGNVVALYFVPIEANRTSYGLDMADVSDAGLLRRGYIEVNQSTSAVVDRGFVCRIKADDKYLYFDGDGHTVTSHDENLNTKEKLVDLA